MSHVHEGPLAQYCSLTDRNLSGYFATSRMRRHLKRAGLIDKRGQIISENQYRLNMARKEHKKHVKDLLAQAIVHKTLDIERNRQVEIKRKLEEISKLEVVRRVRAESKKRSDSAVMTLLTPRLRLPPPPPVPESVHEEENALTPNSLVIYVDDEGRPVTPSKELEGENGRKREEIDTRHLYALDSAALKKYALTLSKMEQGEGLTSPYLISQVPSPPRSARGSTRNSYRDNRYKQTRLNRPRTANSLSPYRGQRTGAVQGTLMLHRQEPAMMHQGEVQTLCEVTMKYYGPNLILPRDQRDPTQDVEIEQQHCGGNTLPVFKERIKPGDEFTFISRRHRGYPFSLSIYVDGRISARVSTCCEYGHAKGVRLGGKMGQFCLKTVNGATPCYKCKMNSQASPRPLKRPTSTKKQQKVEEIKEEIIVLRPEKKGKEEEDKYDDDFEDEESGSKKDSGTEKYKDDFESDEDSKKEPVRRRSRSSSSSSSSSRSPTPTPRKGSDDDRKIYGLRADEDVKKIQSEDEKSDIPLKIVGHSDEDEQPESKKWTQRQTEVKQRRGSSSSSSSSSSARSRDSIKEKREKKIYIQPSSETTEETKTESTVSEKHVSVENERKEQPARRRKSSSSSSSSDSDADVKRYSKKLEEEERRRDEQQRREDERRIDQERRREEQQKREEERQFEQQRRKDELEQREQERRLEQQIKEEEGSRREEERRREEEQRKWADEEEKRRLEEKRKRDEEDVKRREAYANRRSVSHISSTPDMDYIPEPVSYSTMLEDERQQALEEVKQEMEVEYVKKVTRSRSSSSSSSSESEKEEPKLVTPPKVSSPYKKSSSSSSSSDSETDTGRGQAKVAPPRTPSPAKVTPPRSRATSSSSSSDSETETDADKKVVKKPSLVPSPKKSSSSSSSSETETTTDTDQKSPKPVVPVKEDPKPIVEEKESSSSDSSDSETETQTETDNEKVPKQAQPTEPLVTIIESKKTHDSSSSSDSETETETATETETDNEKVKKELEQGKLAPIQEKAKPSSGSSSSGSSSDSETDVEKPKPVQAPPPPPPVQEKKEEVKTDVKKDTTTESSSGSSDSSSDSSDSEDEEKRKAAEIEKKESKQEAPPGDQEKTNSDVPFISESEGEQKPVTIFASESDGDNMHGGNDPDNIASSSPEVKSYLTKIGVAPSQPVEGTVTFMMEGKKDLELNNIALTSSQATEVADFLSKGDNVKSVCLRNAGIDDGKFESIAESLKSTKSNPVMLNFNLNKMKKDSMEKIVEVLIEKPSVEILLLHGNPLGDDGVKTLVNGLLDCHEAFRQQQETEETKNKMADDKQEVERETTRFCVLKELDLGDTDVGNEGMDHIAHFLENDSDLRTLNLNGNNRVSYTGWKRLSKALKKNKTLQSLTLDFNKIGDEGIAALVNGLKVNTNLRTLDLESTGLTEEGGLMLVDLVKCNTTILEVTILPGNKILDKTQEEIRNYLGLNKAASSTMSESK